MPKILSLEMQGFKSFANKTKMTYPDGLVVAVGPNGSGKTNIMDAICFVLGKTSKKELRATKLSHLVFNGGKGSRGADFARVSLNLDNSKNEFPYKGKIFQISRTVDTDGVSTFRINGTRCTLAEVKNALINANINPDGFNIIMQGEIARFADLPSTERRYIVEDIAGIKTYEEKKNKSLNELDRVEGKIREGEITLKEKKKYLDELTVDKLQAEKFLKKKRDLELTRGILTKKKLQNKEAEHKSYSDNIEKTKNEQENTKEKLSVVLNEISDKEKEISEISKKLDKGGEEERSELEKSIALLQDEMNDLNVVIKAHKKELERLDQREKQIKNSLLENQEELEKMESEETKLKKTMSDMKADLSSRKKLLTDLSSSDYFKLKSELSEIEKLKMKEERLLDDMEDKWKKRIDIEEIKDNITDYENQLKGIKNDIDDAKIELKKSKEKREEVEKYLSHLKIEKVRIEERREVQSDGYDSITWLLEQKYEGVLGVLSELIKTDDSLLLSVVQSRNGVVVSNKNIAEKCIKELEENQVGIVRFYPLISGNMKSSVSSKFRTDEKFRNIFESLFKEVSIDEKKIIDGISIIGGYTAGEKGLEQRIDEILKDIEKYSNYLSDIQNQIRDKNKELSDLERKEMGLKKDVEILEQKMKNIKSVLADIDEESIAKIKVKCVSYEKKENEINLMLKKSSGVSEDEVGEINKGIEDGEENLDQLNRQLIQLQTRMDNIIKKDISSFESILSSINKDKDRFKNELDGSSKRFKVVEQELKKKKAAEKEFYEKLKRYFNARDKLRNDLSGIENRKVRMEQKIEMGEKEIQNIRIKMAEVSGNIEGLREQMKDFKGIEIPGTRKDERELELEVRDLERNVASFGAVNMKALETFKEIESEYNSLNDKVKKLEEERQKVISMIEEIEGKKKAEFMRTFRDINKNLDDIFGTLSPGGSAKLVLDNPEEPFEGGIDVLARPSGKKTIPMRLLSGGEKTLVALSFVFAIQEYQPAPFYILDEIDAALDKYNSEKLAELLNKYSKKAQFILISHNDEIISSADYMYGVSMKDNGISQIVSIRLPE